MSHSAPQTVNYTVTVTVAAPLWTGVQGQYTGRQLGKGSRWKVTATTKAANGSQWYELGGNQWINANSAQRQSSYQNPSQYWQISATQIKPQGTVGYNLRLGSEGSRPG